MSDAGGSSSVSVRSDWSDGEMGAGPRGVGDWVTRFSGVETSEPAVFGLAESAGSGGASDDAMFEFRVLRRSYSSLASLKSQISRIFHGAGCIVLVGQ